jgi:hypothetical protein
MNKFVVTSPCYEILRFGHNIVKSHTADAHAQGKFSKFVIGPADLINPSLPPTIDNFRFECCQVDQADVVIYVDQNRKSTILKGAAFCK